MSERMSEERFVFVRECIESDLKTSILVHGAPDRQFDSFKVNKELLAEIDALRAELTAARTVVDGEVSSTIEELNYYTPGMLAPRSLMKQAADLLTRLSAAKAEAERDAREQKEKLVRVEGYRVQAERERDEAQEKADQNHTAMCRALNRAQEQLATAERERDSARADALEEAAKVFDAIPDETELSPEHWQEDPDTGFRVKVGRTTKRAALRPSFIAARIRALIAQGEQ